MGKDLFGEEIPLPDQPAPFERGPGPGTDSPLAARLRPDNLAGFVGQQHLVGEGQILHKVITSGRAHSMLFWGPPGVGKTTLALLIASASDSDFARLSAVTDGVKELRQAVDTAKKTVQATGRKTLLFLDEIHRFSKSQQDALLPHVENGDITLIGATTENPSFQVIAPLLSRLRIYVLNPLSEDDLRQVIRAAVSRLQSEKEAQFALDDDAESFFLNCCQGDARALVNAVENAFAYTDGGRVNVEAAEQVVQGAARHYRDGEAHYDTISAFIKSMRASDPDAAVYYLARMLDGGEDPLFIARRLVILAAEDIGLADPQALTLAVSAQQAVSFIGLPEGRLVLAEATLYLALAPKSNSAFMAIRNALKEAAETRSEPVPMHLRNASTDLMKSLGYGEGYELPHNSPGGLVAKNNLPDRLHNRQYYRPSNNSAEQEAAERQAPHRAARRNNRNSD